MNKKAIVFMPMFTILVIVALSLSYYNLVIKTVTSQYIQIGGNQVDIIKGYEKGEEYAFNAENTVKFASDITIEKFSKIGGVAENCNDLWKFDSLCHPDLENKFVEIFNNELISYGYEAKDVKIENNFLIVNLKDFTYVKDSKNFKVEYILPVTVKQELNIDIGKLNSIKDEIRKCLEKGKPLNTCTNEKNTIQGDIIQFTIENNKNIMIYTDKIETKKPGFIFKINTKDTGASIKQTKPF